MARRRKDYRVGFGKPPRKNRFQKGASGNPRGRPKGSKNFTTVIKAELNRKVAVTEGGRQRKIPKRQVIATQLVNRAASGDAKATQTLINHETRTETADDSGPPLEVFDREEDHLVIAEIVRRIRAADAPSEPVADPSNPKRRINK